MSQEETKLLPRDSVTPDVIPDSAGSGERWQTEELHACTPLEDEEIPGCDEETKVALLPVNPHLLYVYWEFSARDLEKVNRLFSRLGPRARPALRFYETAQAGSDSLNAASWFDVAIALSAGKWYVRLDHPADSYCLDLGLCLAGGLFRSLARSNVVEMPKTRPSENTEERYLQVDYKHSPAQVVVTPAEVKTQAWPGQLQELGEALRTVPAFVEPHSRDVNRPEHRGASPPVPASPGHPGGQEKPAAHPSAAHSSPLSDALKAHGEMETEIAGARPPSAAVAGSADRQIAELHVQRNWDRAWWPLAVEKWDEPQAEAAVRTDLTELTERNFRAGLSSGQKSP